MFDGVLFFLVVIVSSYLALLVVRGAFGSWSWFHIDDRTLASAADFWDGPTRTSRRTTT